MTAATLEPPAAISDEATAAADLAGDEDEDGAVSPEGALVGAELLAKVKALGDAPKSELVRSCGYVSTKKDGTERLNFTAFYEALLNAKGMNLGGGSASAGRRRGRKLSGKTKVLFNGNLLIGKAYTSQMGLQAGDEFEIRLGRGSITLQPTGRNVPPQAGSQDEGQPEA
jgi:hypothetical protein